MRKPKFLYTIMYPIGVLLSKMPTLTYGIKELNPLKQVWAVQYKQSPPNIVWFWEYPNQMNVEHIGKNSNSGNAVVLTKYVRCKIGDNVRIARDVKIIHKEGILKGFGPANAPRIEIGNNVIIGWGAMLMVSTSGMKICDNVAIGAGSIVTKTITKSGTYAGVPAKYIGKRKIEIVDSE